MTNTQVPERLRTGNRVKVVISFDGLPVGATGLVINHTATEVSIQYDLGCIMWTNCKAADRCLMTVRRLTA